MLIQWIWVMIVRRHSDLVNTKESMFSFCDKSHHTNKRKVQKREIKVLCGTVHYDAISSMLLVDATLLHVVNDVN